MKVVLASKNPHKLVEISQITRKFHMELVLESDLGVDIDVEETGTTFEENSFLKANAVMKATGLPALADDSGIAVDALTGSRASIPPGTVSMTPWMTRAGSGCFLRIWKRSPMDSGRPNSSVSSPW